MRPWIGLGVLVIALIETFTILPPRRPSERPPRAFRQGAIHVHSHFSHDGGGTVPEIAAAARAEGLDFVILTDHDSVGAFRAGQEQAYDGVDVYVALEASTPAGHLIAFPTNELMTQKGDQALVDLSWNHYLGNSSTTELFVAIAHPSNLKRPWDRLDRPSEGIEVFNFDSSWQRQAMESFAGFSLTLFLLPLNPFVGLARFSEPFRKDLVAWDSMNSLSQGTFGYLAHDTHAKLILRRDLSLRWPDYPETFRIASNLVWVALPESADFQERRRQTFEAIRAGKLGFGFSYLYPVEGSDWLYACADGTGYRSGESTSQRQCEFQLTLPPGMPFPITARLFRDGNLESETRVAGTLRIPPSGPGLYRMELWAELRTPLGIALSEPTPYLFFNPITVR